MKIDLPVFKNIEERDSYLIKNHDSFCYAKKGAFKEAEPIDIPFTIIKDEVNKAEGAEESEETDVIKIRAIINTTNIMDSHKDVHIPGCFNRTVKENKRIKHVQEHGNTFKHIISDKNDLKVFIKDYNWKDLGINSENKTQALVFDSNVRKSRNEYMHKQYVDKNVDNHSVGMYYVQVKFALNTKSKEGAHLKQEYDKHIDSILNKAEVEKDGYFYAVYELKVKEGSAVPDGSNPITPTLHSSKDIVKLEKKTLAKKEALSIIKNLIN